ncbi:MAG: transposase family protein [Prolixibacteraceae bacterium]|nr:transposase family protein [Burkholderiales bacterium]
MDITYIPMRRGFVYLAWCWTGRAARCLPSASRTAWADFCVEVLEQALERYGAPEIFNTDQGSQFTSTEFVATLQARNIRISTHPLRAASLSITNGARTLRLTETPPQAAYCAPFELKKAA